MKRLIIGYSCLAIVSLIGILYVILPRSSNDVEDQKAHTTYVDESAQPDPTDECSSTEVVTEEVIKPGDAPAEHTVYEYFDMLPENVKNAFNRNWTFEKTDYDLGEHFYNGECTVAGITNYNERKVYIDKNPNADRSILHEIGHCFAYDPSLLGPNSDDFEKLYDEHWAEWYTSYGGHIKNYDTVDEAYAQCYEIYFIAPECLDEDTKTFIACEIFLIS